MLPAYIEEEACIRVQIAAKKSLKQMKDDFIGKITTQMTQEQVQSISSSVLDHITLPQHPSEAVAVDQVEFPMLDEALPELDWQGLSMMEAAIRKLQETAHY